ncbi:hypothetical protein WH47_04001 [Habropoda laboriosa]|uniref:Elongator complex protein 5 n=1 Tax=Habropoda laboriosa TaxID=597456 RepID=A0A0L7QUC4_9HYME|nr:PREDICTED: elongator complex protein 5 [Habropoda laboriosa]KOC62243.1 hypothetical protein WH47_04001 [Habropoda laboriosa]
MTSIKMLPLLEGANLIVLDEGVDVMYARKLIAGWIQMRKVKDPNHTFDLLLFSGPKSSYQSEPGPFLSNSVNIYDYYTVDINELDINIIYKKDFHSLEHILKSVSVKSTVIIDCLSSLMLFIGMSKALWFLEKLSTQVPQVICIYRQDFVKNKLACIETLGTTHVKIQKFSDIQINKGLHYMVEFVHRKVGGGVLRQQELVNQSITSYEIQSEKFEQDKKSEFAYENYKQKIESSFRIEINEKEMKQKQETVLPYLINTNVVNTSKIHYQPEDMDDFDEEDPDDDLCF